MSHPRSLDLEALACGDDDARTSRHVAECAQCRAYVARAVALVASPRPVFELPEASASMGVDRPAKAPSSAAAPRPRAAVIALMASSFAVAAAAALLFQARRAHDEPAGDAVAAHAPDARGIDAVRSSTDGIGRGETAFKGGVQLALVRDRRGVQERLTGPVRVRRGDRLRFEIALDHDDDLVAGVVADDGSFVPVMDDGVRSRGTHYSSRALGVDGSPLSGYAVVGSPAAVDAARRRGDLSGVASIRIEWEAEP